MPKFEIVPLVELKTRISTELLAMVEKFKDDIVKLRSDQGGRYVLEKTDDARKIRKALKLAVASIGKEVRFPRRGEEGSVSFYLHDQPKRRGRKSGPGIQVPKPRPKKK